MKKRGGSVYGLEFIQENLLIYGKLMEKLTAGLKGYGNFIVKESDSAKAFRSGSLAVLATPVLIASAEETCADLVQPLLDEGMGTVGTRVDIRHLAPTPIGMKYHCECELTGVEGRKLLFSVTLYDEKEQIAEGTHERFIINNERFFAKAQNKAAKA